MKTDFMVMTNGSSNTLASTGLGKECTVNAFNSPMVVTAIEEEVEILVATKFDALKSLKGIETPKVPLAAMGM